MNLPFRRLSALLCLLFAPLAWSQSDENMDGIPMLTRPGYQAPGEEIEIDPNDPLADEKRELQVWEKNLKATSAALEERMAEVVSLEATIGQEEEEVARQEAALDERENSLLNRERIVRSRETMPAVRPWTGGSAPSSTTRAVMVIDANNGRILYEKNARTEVAVASTQKLMTALLVIEAGDLDQEITIEVEDTRVEPSILGFKPGETYTRRELVRWLLIRSGNDVAKALARDNAGSVEAFAVRMNQRARELGMTNSNFRNPHGLTEPGQHSTARDMAILAWECYNVPFIKECTSTSSFTLTLDSGEVRTATNTNRVLRSYTWCNGMKTGYTNASRSCLIASGEKNGRARIAVLLGCPSYRTCAAEAHNFLEWAHSAE